MRTDTINAQEFHTRMGERGMRVFRERGILQQQHQQCRISATTHSRISQSDTTTTTSTMSDIGDYTHSDIYRAHAILTHSCFGGVCLGGVRCPETTDGLKSFMKWFPAGRFVNDIRGRWHDNPKSRVPVDVRDCARGSMCRLVRFFNVLVLWGVYKDYTPQRSTTTT